MASSDADLEKLGADGTRLRPADDWTCPDCGARWHLDYSGLMVEVD